MSVTDPKSLSFSAAKADQKAFLLAKPDGAAWVDFFDGSAGTLIVEYLAGMEIYLAHHTITGRAEAFLKYARKLSSGIAAAQGLGYSTFRGQKAHHNLTIKSNFTGTINKFDIIGAVRGQDVIALEDKVVNDGVDFEIKVVFGDFQTESQSIASGTQKSTRFTLPRVSEDFRILLNGLTEVPVSTTVSDLANDKYVVLSNALGALDAIYLNLSTGAYTYDTGDTLQLQFIEFEDDLTIVASDIVPTVGTVTDLDDQTAWVASTAYSLGDIVVPLVDNGFYYRATVAGTSGATEPTFPTTIGITVVDFGVTWTAFSVLNVADVRLGAETLDDVRVNAPLAHETQKLIRGRADYKKTYKGLDTRIVSTNGHDVSAAVVEITAVKDDLTLFSAGEKAAFVTSLMAFRPFGTQPPIIVDPVRINADIQVDITVLTGVTVPGDLTTQATAVVQGFQKILEQTLDLELMEALINQLENDNDESFVRINRVALTSDWALDTLYLISHVISPTTPTFYFKSIDNVRDLWAASTAYLEGARVVPTTPNGFFYEATTIIGDGTSDSLEPVSWPLTPGDTVVDNNVTWTNLGPIIKPWQASFVTLLDEMVSPTSLTPTHYFKAIDNIEEDWQASTVYALNDLIVPTNNVVNQNEYLFEATGVSGGGLSGASEPASWPIALGGTVVDNDIVWTNRGTVVPRWQPTQTYTAGDIIVPATPTSPRRAFQVTSGGVSGSSEPAWDTDLGDPTADGSVAWIAIEEGTTGPTEPTWPTAETDYVGDGALAWKTLLIGTTGPTEPTWPTVVGYTVIDDATIWENVGANNVILSIDWDEFWFFSVTVNVT
jgi:hypothetical protein